MHDPLDPSSKVMTDPLLTPNDARFCLFPIQHDDVYKMYKQAVASFWCVACVPAGMRLVA
jgi:hypothetical protein